MFLLICALLISAAVSSPSVQRVGQSKPTEASWTFAGPRTYYARSDPLKITSAGAIQDVVQANGAWFVGSVNGGVWRSRDISVAVPAWEPVLDGQPVLCSSISAMHVSWTGHIYVGCGGSTSSEQGDDWNVVNSGDWAGLMVSRDSGDTWAMLPAFPVNYYVTAIEEVGSNLLISAQSHLFDREDGGIWLSDDGGASFSRVQNLPTFTLTTLGSGTGMVLATHARLPSRTVSISHDSGSTWSDFDSASMDWNGSPFYTCAALLADGATLIVAGLTVQPDDPTKTNSAFFVRRLGHQTTHWQAPWQPLSQPTSMDEDGMPKDRMAILGDPDDSKWLYVAGNAGALAWRVDMQTGDWIKMWDEDVPDGSLPHGDCRNYAWDASSGRLVLVSDGGIFAREQPRSAGGRWVSLNGDMGQMEFLSAQYDSRSDRVVAGAQDNCAQIFAADGRSVAVGFVSGDGTVTLVDNSQSPARLFGTTQFLGVGTIDIDPSRRARGPRDGGDDDDGCGGLCFVQGDEFVEVPVTKYFQESSSFPFFVQQFTLNSQLPSMLVFWTNGTEQRPSAFYSFEIAPGTTEPSQIGAPTREIPTPPNKLILDFVVGGFTAGVSDPSLIVAMTSTELLVRSAATSDEGVWLPLPARFAEPVVLTYDNEGTRVLGPISHGRSVSLTVSPSDSNIIAVTGWPTVRSNTGPELVFITRDGGRSWLNATGNLREATGVVGKVRPGGILLVDLLKNNDHALLVGTSNGVYAAYLQNGAIWGSWNWKRLGTFSDFPRVLTAGLSYEPYSDTLVAATMGRGVYLLRQAKDKLLAARQSMQGEPAWVPEESSARFFPPQEAASPAVIELVV